MESEMLSHAVKWRNFEVNCGWPAVQSAFWIQNQYLLWDYVQIDIGIEDKC
jgi:hypothetical protein